MSARLCLRMGRFILSNLLKVRILPYNRATGVAMEPASSRHQREGVRLRQIAFALILASTAAVAQQSAPETAPSIPYNSVPDFFKLPPDMFFGEAAGVAVNSKGHVFVFSRGGTSGPAYGAAAAQLLEFDADGKYLREIGRNLYAWSFAHAVRIDKDDNIWAVDKGSDMVIKFDPEGRVTMVFGRKKEASDEADEPWKHPSPPAAPVDGMFRQVTDVTWDGAGNTYISDGYINSRVAKYDPDGNWIKSWGEFGTGPGQFRVLHSIQADAEGNIYVGDRGNGRIQVFDGEGNLIRNHPDRSPVRLREGAPGDRAETRRAGRQPRKLWRRADDGAGRALGALHHPAAQSGAL